MLSCVQLLATSWVVAARFLCPRDFPGSNTGVGCHFLLHGIFPTQGLNTGLLHCKQTLYHLSHQGSPLYKVHSKVQRIPLTLEPQPSLKFDSIYIFYHTIYLNSPSFSLKIWEYVHITRSLAFNIYMCLITNVIKWQCMTVFPCHFFDKQWSYFGFNISLNFIFPQGM